MEKRCAGLGINKNLNDIIKHKWFSTLLPNSWNTENPVMQCQKHCGKFEKLKKIIIQYYLRILLIMLKRNFQK